MTAETNERGRGGGRGAALLERSEGSLPYRRVGSLSSSKRDPASGETTYFLKVAGDDVLQFGEKEYFLWLALDGTNSVADIQTKFRGRFGGSLSPEQLQRFIDQLVDGGAVEKLRPREAIPPRPAESPPDQPEPQALLEAERLGLGIPLGNPTAILRTLDLMSGPLRYFRWLLLPALIGIPIAVAIDAAGIALAVAAINPWQALAFGVIALLVTGIVPPLSQAVAATFLELPTPACRIALRAGVIPQLVFDDAAWATMLSRRVLMVVAAPSVARLALFAAGTGIWLATRWTGGWLSVCALAIGLAGLASFLIGAAPFLPTDGRRWLATAFGRSDFWSAEAGCRAPAVGLSVLWLAVVGGIIAVAGCIALQTPHAGWYGPATGRVVANIQAVALPLLAIAPVVTRLWISGLLRSHGALQPSYEPRHAAYGRAGGAVALDPAGFLPDAGLRQSRAFADVPAWPGRRQQSVERWPSSKGLIIWATIVGLCIAIGFLAYPYEAGGYFTILPYDQNQINAEIVRPGAELTEVLVNEGDHVKPGQLLGTLSDWPQKYNVAVAKAQLESAAADLQYLLHSPLPQAVELARKQYEAAMARLPYDKAQFERYAALVINDTVTRSQYDQTLSQYQQDQAAVEVARANYDQVRTPPTPDQIEQARAKVRLATDAVTYSEDELERTRVRSKSYGVVVTPNPMLMRGKWFDPGGTIFTIAKTDPIQADVQVPETDIDHVRLGGPVRLRVWGIPEETFIGRAMSVAPIGQTPKAADSADPQSGYSNVVRVRVEVPNPEDRLHANTDGYAKMTGYYMPVWRAYGLMMERFLLIEIWSWIP